MFRLKHTLYLVILLSMASSETLKNPDYTVIESHGKIQIRQYSKYVINSLMNIWGKKVNNKYYITQDVFVKKLYNKPDGFFRDKLI